MAAWNIDCALFLQLTGAELGEYGEYWIDEQGIRSFLDNSPEKLRLLASHEQAWRLAFDRDARLSFPVASERLIEWCRDQGGEFVLAAWFVEAANSGTRDAALRVLDATEQELEANITKKNSGSSGKTRVIELLSIGDLMAERDALLHLRKQLGQGSAHNIVQSKRKRSDALEIDIAAARENLGPSATPCEILLLLKKWIGKPGCSVLSVARDSVEWQDYSGVKKSLTSEAFLKRLSRNRRA